MAEKVTKLGLKREGTHLYYLTGEGHVARKHKKDGSTEIVHQNAVKREPGHLYFLDKEGDVSRSPMVSRAKK